VVQNGSNKRQAFSVISGNQPRRRKTNAAATTETNQFQAKNT
jgi:hypothetical protein